MVDMPSTPVVSRFELGEPDLKRILHGFAVREQIVGFLVNAPRGDAIGAAMAFLLRAAELDPGQMRAVLNAPTVRSDGSTVKMIDAITQLVK